jgi:hypothetical protein
MDRTGWLRVAALLVLVLGVALAISLPESCTVPRSPSVYQRLTADCDSRLFLRVLIGGVGAVLAVGVLAVSARRPPGR